MIASHDLHIHTYLSSCCQAKEEQRPAKIIKRAEEMGMKIIGFADHLWTNSALKPTLWYKEQDEKHIQQLREDMRKCDASSVKVLIGCEADTVAPGKYSVTKEFADTLDFALLSCSHFHMKDLVEQPADSSPAGFAKHILSFFRAGITSGIPTSIAHPLLPMGSEAIWEKAMETLSDNELFDAFALAKEHNVALEITLSYLPPEMKGQEGTSLWSIETPIRLLTLAKKAGCFFTCGSDAHNAKAQEQIVHLEKLLNKTCIMENDFLSLTR
jgi:histidinol phosphatase-like PHP family hydrolase